MYISALTIGIMVSILLILFFAGSEIAFISANRLNIELKKKQNTLTGKILGRYLDAPYEFIATNVVGITFSLVLYSLLISRVIEPIIANIVRNIGWQHPTLVLVLSLLLDIVFATILILLIVELLPKAIFKRKANSVLALFALPGRLFYWLLYPPTKMLIEVAEFMLKYLFNVKIKQDKHPFQRIDLEHFVKFSLQGTDGQGETIKQNLFANTLRLLKIKVRSCMVPRNEIIALPHDASMADVQAKFLDTKLSRVPVYQRHIDNIVGYLHHLDLHKQPPQMDDILHAIPKVPDAMNVLSAMQLLNKEKKSIAWVIDEYGGTAGIITLEDILEEIFGTIEDEYDGKLLLEQQIDAHTFLFSGRHTLAYLNEQYKLDIAAEGNAETLSGYIIQNLGSIPQQGDKFIIKNLEFDILLMATARIETVKVKMLS